MMLRFILANAIVTEMNASSGLRIAPPEAPVTGYMFSKGVYFADMFSKSAKKTMFWSVRGYCIS